MSKKLQSLLKLAVGLGLLYLLFTRLEEPAKLWQQIASANLWLLLAGAACYTAAVALSAVKWGILLAAIGLSVPLGRLLNYQWVAEFFNHFLPAQVGGDVMRGYALATDTHRRADAAASILIDRFIGLLVFMLGAACAAVILLWGGRPDGATFSDEALISLRLIALGSVGASLTLVALLGAMLSRRLKTVIEQLLVRLPLAQHTVPIWQKLALAFNAYRDQHRALGLTVLGSVGIVILTSVNIWLIANALTPNSIALAEVLAINPIIVFIGLVVPLAPGGLGVRQGAFYATFLLLGRSGELGLAAGLLQHFIGYLVSLPGGYLWVRGGAKTKPDERASDGRVSERESSAASIQQR
jgi:hypothetical protein